MNLSDVRSVTIPEGVVVRILSGDTVLWKSNNILRWDIAERTAVSDMYAGPNDTKVIKSDKYYVGASSTGAMYYNMISDVSVNGSDVTFTSSSKAVGIGLPYHLEAGASYTFSCTASASARLRVYQLNADGIFVNGSETYSNSGMDLSHTFTAPEDETIWTMLLLDTNSEGTSITYTDINFVKTV